jgi:hypothetical protein
MTTKPDAGEELTDAEMDALVIADVDDPSAWGEPILVHSTKSLRPEWMLQKKRAAEQPTQPPRRDR